MGDARRQIEIRITGQAARGGRVSVGLLARKLQCFQSALSEIAAGRVDRGRDPSKGGRKASSVLTQCELFVVRTESGSFVACLELPPPEPALLEGLPGLAEESLDDLRRVINGVATGDADELAAVLPDPTQRRLVARRVAEMLPGKSDDYGIDFGIGSQPRMTGLTRPDRDRLREVLRLPRGEPRPGGEDLTTIRAFCLAQLDEAGKAMVREVLDYEIVGSHQYRPDVIRWGDREFVLDHGIACAVTIQDDLWVVEYGPLGICAYADSREEAIGEFAEEFSAIWDAYSQADDAGLTFDAVELKQRLRALVREVVHGQ